MESRVPVISFLGVLTKNSGAQICLRVFVSPFKIAFAPVCSKARISDSILELSCAYIDNVGIKNASRKIYFVIPVRFILTRYPIRRSNGPTVQ